MLILFLFCFLYTLMVVVINSRISNRNSKRLSRGGCGCDICVAIGINGGLRKDILRKE